MDMSCRLNLLCLLFIFSVVDSAAQESNYYIYSQANFRENARFQDTIDLKSPDSGILNAVIFYLTNEIRVKNGLTELEYSPKLEASAQLHSEKMVSQHFFDHINPKSGKLREPDDRARYVGILNPYLAENIIEGFLLQYEEGTPVYHGGEGIFRYHPEDKPISAYTYLKLGENLLDRWMNSPKHKANILSSHALQLGCGSAFYLKKDFYEMPALVATQNFQFYEKIKFK
jgi:uncharacterized protein YkwD